MVNGGKSWAVRVKAILLAFKHPGIKIMIVRKSYPELTENHIKPLRQTLMCGTDQAYASYNDSKKEMRFINGSTILFRYCDSEKDVDRYQGTEVDILFIDEATQFTESQIKKLMACVRGVNSFPKRVYMTCNPGGIGHGYIKRIFIDKKYELGEAPEDYSFIQSLVTDNVALMKADPDYVKQLEALPPSLRKAWKDGDWNSFEGAYFEEFRTEPILDKCIEHNISPEEAKRQKRWTHVIEPFNIPFEWKIFRSYDWGYGKPFSCAWWAMDYEGCLYRILELYGCTGTPNEGVKWSNKQQFDEIQRIEKEHPWLKDRKIQGVADPSIWDKSHGPSAAEEADKHQLWFEPGNNNRIQGWMQVRERLKFDANGRAMMYFFSNCEAIIRTMPLMMFDEHKVEDLDTEMEDHACLVGSTQVMTDKGYRNLKDLVGTEGYVLSSDGQYHKYHDCMLTRHNADVYEVELEDGTKIVGTADHRIMAEDGSWVTIGELLREVREVKTTQSNLKVKCVKPIGKADVYNMTVDDTHDFVIQGGVITHNCDEVRYMCMMRPIAPRKIETELKPMVDPLNQFKKQNGVWTPYYSI